MSSNPISSKALSIHSTELTPHLYSAGYDRSGDEESPLLNTQDVRQRDSSECGVAACMIVSRFHKVGTEDLDELRELLGTTEEGGTPPDAIVDYLESLGLQVEDQQEMSLQDLADYWEKGWPVLVPIQEYADPEEEEEHPQKVKQEEEKTFDHGHWVVVIGGPAGGFVYIQDPAKDNILNEVDLPKKKIETKKDKEKGRARVPALKWLKIWHDKDRDGNIYMRYGIAVGPPVAGKEGKKALPEGESSSSKKPPGGAGEPTPSASAVGGGGGGGDPTPPPPPGGKSFRGRKGGMVTSSPYASDISTTPRSGGNLFGTAQVSNLKKPTDPINPPNGVNFDSPPTRDKAFTSDGELGWRCERVTEGGPACEFSLLQGGDEDMDMDAHVHSPISNQEDWERAHPDRYNRSEKKEMPVCPDGRKEPPAIGSCGGTEGWKELDPSTGSHFIFYRQAYDRWRIKPDIIGERRLRLGFQRGTPADELAIRNDEEYRLTRESGTEERFQNQISSDLPQEAGLTPGEELEDPSGMPLRSPAGVYCPDGKPMNPRTRTCDEKEEDSGYPGIDEQHIEQEDRHVGGQRAGKSISIKEEEGDYSNPPPGQTGPDPTLPHHTGPHRTSTDYPLSLEDNTNIGQIQEEKEHKAWGERCPDGSLKPLGTGSCQGRQANSWDGLIDKDNDYYTEDEWHDYPDYAPVVGIDTRDLAEREEPLVGFLFPNKKAMKVDPSPVGWKKALERLGFLPEE